MTCRRTNDDEFYYFILTPRVRGLYVCNNNKHLFPPFSYYVTLDPRWGTSARLSNVGQLLDGWPKIYYLELLHASEAPLTRWSLLHLQSLALTYLHWARVVGYGPFSLCVIHKEGLCPSSGDINRLMMMICYPLRLLTGAMLILKCFSTILCIIL
jgi:hypothetical protein